mmetsp:Transcript_36591/g.82045  ORF Transcript_36591/g.82045 Transcript_36591/m.82045 type:complete len:306 (-) Transcript_36591:187-1104(-)
MAQKGHNVFEGPLLTASARAALSENRRACGIEAADVEVASEGCATWEDLRTSLGAEEGVLQAKEAPGPFASEAAAAGKYPTLVTTLEASGMTLEQLKEAANPALVRSSSSKDKAGYAMAVLQTAAKRHLRIRFPKGSIDVFQDGSLQISSRAQLAFSKAFSTQEAARAEWAALITEAAATNAWGTPGGIKPFPSYSSSDKTGAPMLPAAEAPGGRGESGPSNGQLPGPKEGAAPEAQDTCSDQAPERKKTRAPNKKKRGPARKTRQKKENSLLQDSPSQVPSFSNFYAAVLVIVAATGYFHFIKR